MHLEFTPNPPLKLCSLRPPNISMKLNLPPLTGISCHISVAFTPKPTPSYLDPLFCSVTPQPGSSHLGHFFSGSYTSSSFFSDPKMSPIFCPNPLLFVPTCIPGGIASTPSLKISESPALMAHIGLSIHLSNHLPDIANQKSHKPVNPSILKRERIMVYPGHLSPSGFPILVGTVGSMVFSPNICHSEPVNGTLFGKKFLQM